MHTCSRFLTFSVAWCIIVGVHFANGESDLSVLSPSAQWSIPAGTGMGGPVSSIYDKPVDEVYYRAVAGRLINTILC